MPSICSKSSDLVLSDEDSLKKERQFSGTVDEKDWEDHVSWEISSPKENRRNPKFGKLNSGSCQSPQGLAKL